MPTESVLLYGAGGHGKVVLDALLLGGSARSDVEVCDDTAGAVGTDFLGSAVLKPAECAGRRFHVTIGANRARERIHLRLVGEGRMPLTIAHPRAAVSPHAVLGPGTFVAAQAVVAPSASLGAAVIVNHGAVVDHDCVVGAFSHVAPTASLGGNVTIGQRVLIGAGANILPGLTVGDDAVIGAGAVVCSNVPAGATWAGVPAAPLDRKAK